MSQQITASQVAEYVESNWNNPQQASVINPIRKAYEARNDAELTRLIKKLIEAIWGIFKTPTDIIASAVKAVKKVFTG